MNSAKPTKNKGERVIEYLRAAIFDGKCGLRDVPELVKQIIREDLWRTRVLPKSGEKIEFTSFAEFLAAAPPEGLGADYQTLRKLCFDDPQTLELLELTRASRAQGGDRRSADFKDNNVIFEKAGQGNSTGYALKRLRKSRPDLHEQVIKRKMSVNQAMVRAGFRKRPVQITNDLHKTAEALKSAFSAGELEQLISLLQAND